MTTTGPVDISKATRVLEWMPTPLESAVDSICRFYSSALRRKDPAAMKAAKEFFEDEIQAKADFSDLYRLAVARMDGRDPVEDDGVFRAHRGRSGRRNDEL